MPPRNLVPFAGLEDPFSAISHFGSVALVVVYVVGWLRLKEPVSHRLVIAAFCAAWANTFLSSGVYHLLSPENPWRATAWHLDHGAIWLTIATTISATLLLYCPTWRWRKPMLALLWITGLTGLTLEMTVLDQLPPWVSPLLYIAMGWLGLAPLINMLLAGYTRSAAWVFAAGVSCTVGGAMDATQTPVLIPGVIEAHECLHVFVSLGCGLFWWPLQRAATVTAPPPTGLVLGT